MLSMPEPSGSCASRKTMANGPERTFWSPSASVGAIDGECPIWLTALLILSPLTLSE